MSSDDIHDQLAARAIGALPPDEASTVDAAAASDPALAAELRQLQATVAGLERALPRGVPRPDLFAAILAEVAVPDADALAPVVPLDARRRRRRLLPLIAVAAAAAAAIVVVIAPFRGGSTPQARATLAAGTVSGEALLYRDRLVVRLNGLAPAPAGHHYEVWVLPRGSQTMEAVGQITASGAAVSFDAPLPGAGPYVAVDVSVDPDGAVPSGPGPSVVLAEFS